MAEEGSGAAGAENAGGSEGAKGDKAGDQKQQEVAQAAQAAGGDQTDWKAEARKHEKRAKENFQKNQELENRLNQFEEATKSETEKALDKARKEARKEAETEFEKERRSDRLNVAVSKHARDLADVDDVISNLQREGTDSYFDKEGKVDADALKSALDDLLGRKPHLKAGPHGRPSGSANGGEGEGGGGTTMNDLLRAGR